MHKITSLKKKHEFLEVKYKGKTFPNKYFILQYLPLDIDSIKIGLIVTKKVGSAVIRNKIKRRFRAMVYDIFTKQNVNMKKGKYIFIAKKNTYSAVFKIMYDNLMKVCHTINTTFPTTDDAKI